MLNRAETDPLSGNLSRPHERTGNPDSLRSLALPTMVMGVIVPVGLGASAVMASRRSESERVGIAAWIAVTVVGTAAVISAARTMMHAQGSAKPAANRE